MKAEEAVRLTALMLLVTGLSNCGLDQSLDKVEHKSEALTVTWSDLGAGGQTLNGFGPGVQNHTFESASSHNDWLYIPITTGGMNRLNLSTSGFSTPISSPTPNSSPFVAGTIDSNRCQMIFYRTLTGTIAMVPETWDGTNCTVTSSPTVIDTTMFGAGPAVASWQNASCKPPPCINHLQRYDVLASTASGVLKQNTFSGSGSSYTSGTWSGWTTVSGITSSPGIDPALVSPTPGQLAAFVIGTDGDVHFNTFDAVGGWGTWATLGHPSTGTLGRPAASSRNGSTTTMTVYAQGGDQKLYFRTTTNSGVSWSAWDTCGTQTFNSGSFPAATSINHAALGVANEIFMTNGSPLHLWGATCP